MHLSSACKTCRTCFTSTSNRRMLIHWLIHLPKSDLWPLNYQRKTIWSSSSNNRFKVSLVACLKMWRETRTSAHTLPQLSKRRRIRSRTEISSLSKLSRESLTWKRWWRSMSICSIRCRIGAVWEGISNVRLLQIVFNLPPLSKTGFTRALSVV